MGEAQKPVNDKYRENWDKIWKKDLPTTEEVRKMVGEVDG